MKKPLIIFDLDDTLVDTSHVYWQVRSQFISILRHLGHREEEVLNIFESFETLHTQTLGFTPERYHHSMVATYESLVGGHHFVDPSVSAEIARCANLIYVTLPRVIEGAVELLESASTQYNLALLTRGDRRLQIHKIRALNLEQYFFMAPR